MRRQVKAGKVMAVSARKHRKAFPGRANEAYVPRENWLMAGFRV